MNTTELIDPKNFIPQDLEVDLYAVFRMGCNKCNNRYARLIIPVWCRPRSFFSPRLISMEYLEKIYKEYENSPEIEEDEVI